MIELEEKLYELELGPDGVLWKTRKGSTTLPKPYCKEHLAPVHPEDNETLICLKGHESFDLWAPYTAHQGYVRDLINSQKLSELAVVRIDTEGAPVLAKEKEQTNQDYWIESKLRDTKKGLELMVQVGKRDSTGKKVQLFVDLPAERLGFDKSHKDNHPSGLFSEVRAVFKSSETEIRNKAGVAESDSGNS